MDVGLQLCRGDFVGSHHCSDGDYDVIAKTFFKRLNINTYYLEYDTEFAYTFESGAPTTFAEAQERYPPSSNEQIP